MIAEQQLINDCLVKAIICPKALINAQRKLGLRIPNPKSPHALITISFNEIGATNVPEQGTAVAVIGQLHERLQNFKWFKDNEYYLNYEYFSDKYPEGGNLHLAIIVKQTTYTLCKTKIIRDCKAKFKEIFKMVNYQSSSSIEHYINRLNYVKGTKSNARKRSFVECDREWRQQNNISHYYTNACEEKSTEA